MPCRSPDPTEEQLYAVSLPLTKGNITIMDAAAGSGKTTTLEMIADANQALRFLYLCFGAANAAEARRRMPANVSALTTHALAMADVGRAYRHKLGDIRIADVYELLRLDDPVQAAEVIDGLKRFWQSSVREIGPSLWPGFARVEAEQYAALARKLWARICNVADEAAKMPHDGYLKLWALETPVLLDYDAILVDEAQDTNPVVLDILLHQARLRTAAIVLVGDRSQAIYGWRGAANAMEHCAERANNQCGLTESFRFGPLIAGRASTLLRRCAGRDISIKGRGPGPVPEAALQSRAVLARTNGSLMSRAIASTGPIHFAGTKAESTFSPRVAYRFQEALDVFELSKGRPGAVRTPHIRRFKTFAELERFAFVQDYFSDEPEPLDMELAGYCDLVKAHGSNLPHLLADLERRAAGPTARVPTFSTAHKAKGLEWHHVELCDDFIPLYDRTKLAQWKENLSRAQLLEEINVLYVAITRARCSLKMNPLLERWLDQEEAAAI